MRPVTYSLQFRGQASEREAGLRKEASAPGCALVTTLTCEGVEGRHVWSSDVDEAFFESELEFTGEGLFEEYGTIRFARGHALYLRGRGELATSVDPQLRQGTVAWEIAGGEGRFADASGRVTSNFLLSGTGELTENQLGVVFTNGGQGSPGVPVQGSPWRERDAFRETIEPSPGTPGSNSEEEG